MKPTPRSRRAPTTAFVPRAVFATVFVGVVPACAGSNHTAQQPTVAAQGFATSPPPPANGSSDAADAAAPTVQSQTIVLAYVAFDAGATVGQPDAAANDPAASAAPTDAGRAHARRGGAHH